MRCPELWAGNARLRSGSRCGPKRPIVPTDTRTAATQQPGTMASTNRFRFKMAHCRGGLLITRLKIWSKGRSAGQNHVFMNTRPCNRSARSAATHVPIGPPQSWPITMNPSSCRWSTSLPTSSACSAGCEAIPLRAVGEAEAWIVHCDTPEAAAQGQDYLAIEEAPGGIAVAHQDRPAGAFVNVVHADAVGFEPARLEGEHLA